MRGVKNVFRKLAGVVLFADDLVGHAKHKVGRQGPISIMYIQKCTFVGILFKSFSFNLVVFLRSYEVMRSDCLYFSFLYTLVG